MTADVDRMRELIDRWLERTHDIGDALLVTGEDRAEHWRHDLRKLRDRISVDAGRRRGVSPTFALHLSNFERRADRTPCTTSTCSPPSTNSRRSCGARRPR